MNAPPPVVENLTGISAGGAQVIILSTGKGYPSGNPISPTIKVTGNPHKAESVRENIDVDVSDVISKGRSLENAAKILQIFGLRVSLKTNKSSFLPCILSAPIGIQTTPGSGSQEEILVQKGGTYGKRIGRD